MTYNFVSVPRKSSNAGRPQGKKEYVILFRWEDVKEYERDPNGVRVIKFALNDDKKPVAVYGTNSTIAISDTSEGEDDARGFIHTVDFEHPGTGLEISEFKHNNVNENLGAIVLNCSGDDADIAGTPCTPLKMDKAESTNNKEANKNAISLKTSFRGAVLGKIAKSLIPATGDPDIDSVLGLTATGSGSGGL